jgi:hypothetical protein
VRVDLHILQSPCTRTTWEGCSCENRRRQSPFTIRTTAGIPLMARGGRGVHERAYTVAVRIPRRIPKAENPQGQPRERGRHTVGADSGQSLGVRRATSEVRQGGGPVGGGRERCGVVWDCTVWGIVYPDGVLEGTEEVGWVIVVGCLDVHLDGPGGLARLGWCCRCCLWPRSVWRGLHGKMRGDDPGESSVESRLTTHNNCKMYIYQVARYTRPTSPSTQKVTRSIK